MITCTCHSNCPIKFQTDMSRSRSDRHCSLGNLIRVYSKYYFHILLDSFEYIMIKISQFSDIQVKLIYSTCPDLNSIYRFSTYEQSREKTCLWGFPSVATQTGLLLPQKMDRGLKFWIQKEEGLYNLWRKNKGNDQLCGYCTADLRLGFCMYKNQVFS